MTEATQQTKKYRTRLGVRKVNFSISMPLLVKSRLAETAAHEGRSVSSVLTELAIKYIEEKEIETEERKKKVKNALQEIKNKL